MNTSLTPAGFAAMLDSTNLRLDASENDIDGLCREAAAGGFACVMVYPTSVPLAARTLAGTGIKIGTVVGFPSGRFTTASKAVEIDSVAAAGAGEVDVVMDYAVLRAGHTAEVASEVAELTRVAHANGLLIKIITENCYLTEAQMLEALKLCEDAGADFIKTSTGFGSAGARREQIELWAKNRRGNIRLKAAGGIKTLPDALALIAAGASRLGTSGAGALLADFKGGGMAKPPAGERRKPGEGSY